MLLFFLPQTQEYVARLIAGFAGQDLATQMRFGEYKDALILIRRYPLFGVGFTGVPDIDLYLGVSMVYLIIAQNMGLIGLACFLADFDRLLRDGRKRLASRASRRCWSRCCWGWREPWSARWSAASSTTTGST